MKLVTPSGYLLIIALFFFSFCEFNCSGNKLLELRGIEMVTGKDAEKPKEEQVVDQNVEMDEVFNDLKVQQNDIEPMIWADISFGAAILGLSIFLIMAAVGKLGSGKLFYIITSAIGAIAQFAIKIHIDSELSDQKDFQLLSVNYLPAYWAVLGLFIVIIISNLIPDFKIVRQYTSVPPEEDKGYFQNLGNIE